MPDMAPWQLAGGGGGAPSGAAGGVLGGNYPNPGFAVDMATQGELDAASDGDPIDAQSVAATWSARMGLVPTGPGQSALILQRPDDNVWGIGQDYGEGQFLVCLRKADGPAAGEAPEPRMLLRIDRTASLGMAGAIHLGTGLDQDAGYDTGQGTALWINPYIDTRPLVLDRGNVPGAVPLPFFVCQIGGVVKHQIGPDGIAACRVSNSVGQALTTGVAAAVTFDTEGFDTDAMHDPATNPTRLTAKTAGLYLVFGYVNFGANAVGIRQAYIRKNGAGVEAAININAAAAGTTQAPVSALVLMAANDYVELVASQTSGGNLNALAGSQFGAAYQGL